MNLKTVFLTGLELKPGPTRMIVIKQETPSDYWALTMNIANDHVWVTHKIGEVYTPQDIPNWITMA